MFSEKTLKKPCLFFVCILLLLLAFQSSFISIKTFAATTVNIDPNTTYQSIEGWGSSICWWGNQIGGWSENNRNKLIEKIVSPVDGLGYNIFRYNIGGGDAPGHNHMRSYGNIEGYQPSPGVWNWNADATQRAVLQRLVERGKYYGHDMILEAFSNSPPYWMTKSGCASGNTDGSNNLKDDYYDDFAEYLTEVVKHFRDSWGITFRTLEPMNEPNVNWWKANGGQEGCCFTYPMQSKIIKEVGARLKSKGLTGTSVSAADENSIDTAVAGLKTYDAATLSYISQINTHSYSGSQRTSLRDLVKSKGKKLWQSESGPLSFEGNMMDSNIMLSQRIVKDLKDMRADAWLDWQIIDGGNWGSLYVNNAAQTFTLTKKFYMHSNYSRFIRPGYTIIGADSTAAVAAISPDKKKLVIVATNANKTASESITFNLSRFANVQSAVEVYRTSASLDLAKSNITVNSKSIADTLPAYSINTYVISLGDPAVSAIRCDMNGDGAINMSDVIILASSFNTVRGDAGYVDLYDLNRDGAVNMSDVMIVAEKFNTLISDS
jgi:O-glycosyl hydrolase